MEEISIYNNEPINNKQELKIELEIIEKKTNNEDTKMDKLKDENKNKNNKPINKKI